MNNSSSDLVDNSSRTQPPRTLKSTTVNGIADLIKDGHAKRIVILAGAGMSTSAGIPDFRSSSTGLYARLAKLLPLLPYPEAPMHISYFRHTPEPFYVLKRDMYLGRRYKPTIAHAFVALLARRGLLHLLITQNVDGLERVAGVPAEKVLAAHGSFASQRCIECKGSFPDDRMREAVQSGEVPRCDECGGVVKPDVVLFGEPLPERFDAVAPAAVADADLVIIMGTSLKVYPVAGLADKVREGVPRVLVNRDRVGAIGGRPDDVLMIGDCDDGIRQLAKLLEWEEELEALWKEVSSSTGRDDEEEKVTTSETSLDEEIAKLASKMDPNLKISRGHRNWLEKHLLQKKLAMPAGNDPMDSNNPEKDIVQTAAKQD
jgi:NAD-dependent histone deacetylase SIR2